MDFVGHVLLGVAVTGQVTPVVIVASLAPDISALPFQYKKRWKRAHEHPVLLAHYWLWHSPIALWIAWQLPPPVFQCVAAHIIADLLTHKPPFGFIKLYQWDYGWRYAALLALLGGIACVRLFF